VNIDNGFGAGYMAHTINLIGETLAGSASETPQEH
jgi:NCAIR mutase (PurE)-related protein